MKRWMARSLGLAALALMLGAAAGVGAERLAAFRPPFPVLEPPANPAEIPVPQAQPGAKVVELNPAAVEHPDSATVRSVLQIHFDSINFKRYDQWLTTVVSERRRQMPLSKWKDEYETTSDSDIRVHRIEPGTRDSLRVLLSFTSHQDPRDAPADMRLPCLRWHVVYPLVQDSGGLRLDTTFPGNSQHFPC